MYKHSSINTNWSHNLACDHQVPKIFGQGYSEDENNKMLETFNTEKRMFQGKQGTYDCVYIWTNHLLDGQLPHLWHKHYSLGATQILRKVANSLTSEIVGIRYSGKFWKDVNLIHGGKCPAEFISICFNSYLIYYFPLCVQARGTGPKLKSWINRQLSYASPRLMKGVTIEIPSIIGIIFKKALGNL